jgi:acetate kinase
VREIHNFERLAPLHNKSSLELFEPIRRTMVKLPFTPSSDTSFHRTTPDVASLYAIPTGLAQKHNIRRLPQELFDEVLDSVSGRG